MTTESLIDQFYNKLLNAKTPHLILGQIYKQLFQRDLQSKDWAQLGKLTNLYGKWVVLEAMLRASMQPNFDATSPWGYFHTICLSLSKESREDLEHLEKIKQLKEYTETLVSELMKEHKVKKIRGKEYLEN